MKISRPGIIVFTEHYQKCVAFYRDLLGLEIIFTNNSLTCFDFGGAYFMVESNGVSKTEVKNRTENPTVIRFNVENVEATANELQAQDIEISVTKYSWGTIGIFNDPDGNRCELKDALSFDEQCKKNV